MRWLTHTAFNRWIIKEGVCDETRAEELWQHLLGTQERKFNSEYELVVEVNLEEPKAYILSQEHPFSVRSTLSLFGTHTLFVRNTYYVCSEHTFLLFLHELYKLDMDDLFEGALRNVVCSFCA